MVFSPPPTTTTTPNTHTHTHPCWPTPIDLLSLLSLLMQCPFHRCWRILTPAVLLLTNSSSLLSKLTYSPSDPAELSSLQPHLTQCPSPSIDVFSLSAILTYSPIPPHWRIAPFHPCWRMRPLTLLTSPHWPFLPPNPAGTLLSESCWRHAPPIPATILPATIGCKTCSSHDSKGKLNWLDSVCKIPYKTWGYRHGFVLFQEAEGRLWNISMNHLRMTPTWF